jgi:glutathione synthase/RimK-type ligase-like ATP-grasp enzyme
MQKLCFLSMDDLGDYVSDDELVIEPLREFGWEVEIVSWRAKDIDWTRFEAVIIRTPWDYQDEPKEFLKVLQEIENSTRLENPLKIVEWNLSKSYLKDLEKGGIKIVPTIFGNDLVNNDLVDSWFEYFGAEEIIIKPIVSATAQDTFRLKEFSPKLTDIFRGRQYLVQPFMKNIVAEGEFSLFYFDGSFSHAILKTPKQDDFRVQEEFGGIITAIEPSEKLLKAGEKALEQIGQKLLYARVDFVRDDVDEFALMELELIEPALYFRMNRESSKRFAEAFNKWMKK